MARRSSRTIWNADATGRVRDSGPVPPLRTCIACRTVRAKAELMRLVRDEEGTVRVDREGRAAGRGAYACPTIECLEKALHAGRLGHAFKRASRPPQESAASILANRTRR